MKLFKNNWRFAAIQNGVKDAIIYRSEIIVEFLASAIVPAGVQIILWNAMFNIEGNTLIVGQSFQDMMFYTLCSILFSQIRGGNHDFEIAEMIRDGTLSQYLLRPVGPLEFIYFRGMSIKLFITVLCLSLGLIFCVYYHFSFARLLGGMFLAWLGNIILYLFSACVSSSAFIWEEAYSLLMVKNLIVSLLSGELLPLYLVPDSFSWVWKFAPFYLFVYGPTQYTLGKWGHTEFLLNVAIAFCWVLFFKILLDFCWSRGIKHYISVGG